MMESIYEAAKKKAPEEMCGIVTIDNKFIEFKQGPYHQEIDKERF